jgi:HSP20 family molecular chaperone IbpA
MSLIPHTHFLPMTMRDFFFVDPYFRSTWDDFDNLLSVMENESRQHWQRQGDTSVAASGNKGEDTSVATTSEAPWFFPRRWLMPSLLGGAAAGGLGSDVDKMLRNLDIFQQRGDDHVIRLTNDDTKFEVSLDTHGFKPEEIKVKVENGQLMVEGKHEVKEENKYVSREFRRSYALPQECQVDAMKSNLSSDGVLVVTAPKKAIAADTGRAIPIEVAKK